jgi:hypothetical protein
VHRVVAQENTLCRAEGKLVVVIRMEVWPAGTPKSTNKCIVGLFMKQQFYGRGILKGARRQPVDKTAQSEESLIPKPNW